jgi:hypothetical protein
MPTPIQYGLSATLPPIILLSAGTRIADVNPTLAVGDVQINKDYTSWINLTTLPVVVSGGTDVQTVLSSIETTCKSALIRFKDQTVPAEWDERYISIYTYGNSSAFDTRIAGTDGKSLISTDPQNLSGTFHIGSVSTVTGNVLGSVNNVVQATSISSQQIRDAMTLTPTSASQIGSIDEILDTINSNTSAINFSGTVSADIVSINGVSAAAVALSEFTTIDIASQSIGTNLITLISVNELLSRVPNVSVSVYNASNQIVKSVITGSNGDTSFRLDDGSYVFASNKAMTNFADLSATISGDTTITLSGSAIVPIVPASGLQTLYGFVKHGDGVYASACQIIATLEEVGDFVSGNLITSKKISAVSDANGYYELSLLKGSTWSISELWNGKSYFLKSITITSDDSKDVSTYE